MILLSADWHLDDKPENDYRWEAFHHVRVACARHDIRETYILGDLVDRKDRFTAAFVNRLMADLASITPVTILRGNHDTTMREPNYFDWLAQPIAESLEIRYVTEPTEDGDPLLLLPFTPNPIDDWRDYHLADYRAIFMHATVTGARVGNGVVLENPSFPALPPKVKVYSGDIHHPQTIGNLTYVGAPHPTKFGDDYQCRMLLLDEQRFDIVEVIELSPPSKSIFDIKGLGFLESAAAATLVKPGDQIRFRIHGVVDAGEAEARIAAWAQARGVTVAGTEIIVQTTQDRGVDTTQSPETILRQFAEHEAYPTMCWRLGLSS